MELDSDWLKFDEDFRKHYVVFGGYSGDKRLTMDHLRKKRDTLPEGIEKFRPSSFIGYKFSDVNRVSFYSVKKDDFAVSTLYEKQPGSSEWLKSMLVP